MAIKITEEGGIHPTEITCLKDMQRAVGGYIEVARNNVEYEGKKYTMLCDEEGLLKGKSINEWAIEHHRIPVVGDILLVDDKEFN